MEKMIAMARRYQPDVISVNRAANGYFEDYRTPEQLRQLPAKPMLEHTWETDITMGKRFSYRAGDQYKSTRELVHLLLDVVSKGGNLLLNVGPQPDGQLPPPAVKRLNEIGEWMAVNSEAIYGTRPAVPYRDGSVVFTSKGPAVYAVCLAQEGQDELPAEISTPDYQAKPGARICLLGSSAQVSWRTQGKGMVIETPPAARKAPPSKYAFAFKIIN